MLTTALKLLQFELMPMYKWWVMQRMLSDYFSSTKTFAGKTFIRAQCPRHSTSVFSAPVTNLCASKSLIQNCYVCERHKTVCFCTKIKAPFSFWCNLKFYHSSDSYPPASLCASPRTLTAVGGDFLQRGRKRTRCDRNTTPLSASGLRLWLKLSPVVGVQWEAGTA